MKKYKLFLFVFTLFLILLGFNTNSASASNCAAGDLFNSVTGQRCNTNTLVVKCLTGELFSSITGQRCTGVDTLQDNSSTLTQYKFNVLWKSNFKVGLVSNDVKPFQQFLKDQGYYVGNVDGKYGNITARAVKDFQDNYNSRNIVLPKYPTNNSLDTKNSGESQNTLPPVPVVPLTSDQFSSITVISPNGGEVWQPNTVGSIYFTSNLSKQSMKIWAQNITDNSNIIISSNYTTRDNNPNPFDWYPASTVPAGSYKICVGKEVTAPLDCSDSAFTISVPSTNSGNITLTSATIDSSQIYLTYSKTFSACTRLITENGASASSQSFCSSHNGTSVTDGYATRYFTVHAGDRVKLCHGNDYSICSDLMTVVPK